MRTLLKKLLKKPVSRIAYRYSSRPDKRRVHAALTKLYQQIIQHPGTKGVIVPFNKQDKFIILSDQHKGAKNGSDDFSFAEENYLAALDYYHENNFCYINLGDSEELWENSLSSIEKNHQLSFSKEKLFIERNAFFKIFGNHDLYWDNDPLASLSLERIYGQKIKIYEALILQTKINGEILNIYLTHGHQGDQQSDGNWFSKWFIGNIWAPLQIFLELNLNTPAENDSLKTEHNQFMYNWIATKRNTVLVTGHTHQPVFVSLTHLERLYHKLHHAQLARDRKAIEELEAQIKMRQIKEGTIPDFTTYKPTYFNSGCCCFSDGDITGLELTNGYIRLIKWEYNEHNLPTRTVLEEITLEKLL